MARHNKILEHKTTCLHCGHKWNPEILQSIMYEQNKESVNMKCFCGSRYRLFENINGFLVFRKYIMKKDQVKRNAK